VHQKLFWKTGYF